MLIGVDGKALEWTAIVWFSKDPVGYSEINGAVDQHKLNQEAFSLPSRLIAKKFVFRLIFGGTCFAYAQDAEFMQVSNKPDFWQDVIDKFYSKYKGIAKQHKAWIDTAMQEGRLVMPTGRIYDFKPYEIRGERKWPITNIVNYPVQGLGHDWITLARVLLARKLNALREIRPYIKLINTVHDSIYIDTPEQYVPVIIEKIKEAFAEVPAEFTRIFNVPFDLPFRGEISVGKNMLDMEEVV